MVHNGYKIVVLGLVICLGAFGPQTAEGDDKLESAVFFEQHIRPVLASKCVQCHGAKKQEGGLRLDSADALWVGGDSGQAMVAGSPQESLLIEALKYEGFEMPPQGQLAAQQIAHFETWISRGAQWPDHTSVVREDSEKISEEDRRWWPFQPVVKYSPPAVLEEAWVRNDLDRFVLSRLEGKGLQPAPQADKTTLVRRLYFDVIGLPPTPEEVAMFVNDSSAEAWESLIDRLLGDPRYGEHTARYWLDLVRYSESDGWNQDAYRPHIWRYRDYVVDAFNHDKPYPDFVLEQLAGDEMAGDTPEHLVASGFLRLGIYEYNQRDARGHWNDTVNEVTDVVGDVFLGLSMACARCHDHKFDPLPQEDYFKLRAYFEPIVWRDDLVAATKLEQDRYQHQWALWEAATEGIRQRIDAVLQPYYERKWEFTVDKFPLDIQACYHTPESERTSWEQQMAYLITRQFSEEGGGPLRNIKPEHKELLESLETELAAYDELRPVPLPRVTCVTEHTGIISPTIIPDDPDQRPIGPGILSVMSPAANVPSWTVNSSGSAGCRTQLATWIGDSQNPLTTRVIVNRLWQQHFGQGLVATSSDFGRSGSIPTHPELLDWLTATFVEQGWSTKNLRKLILMSATWQQSAHHPLAEEYQYVDPAESLLWRTKIRRLQAEQVRDAMLAASGELDRTLGGPSVDEKSPRRALYVKSFRNNIETFLHAFDMANGLKSVPVRDSTTTPTQALMLFNGDYALGRARAAAKRVALSVGSQPSAQLEHAFLLAWGRQPTEDELASGLQFCGLEPKPYAAHTPIQPERLVDFCHVLFNSNEFLYLE